MTPNSQTPRLVFAMCVEAGGFEAMAVRAARSVRQFGGRFSGCKIFAVTPRLGPPLNRGTLKSFNELGVTHISVRPKNPYAWYPLMNKPITLLQVQQNTDAQQICFLDSDMILMSEPNLLELDTDTDFVACAPDSGIGSAGDDDVNTPFWREACKVLGITFEEVPWIFAHREKVNIRLYFNSGIFTFRTGGPFPAAYKTAVTQLLDAKLSSHISNIYMNEQASVGLVVVKEKLRWKPLPHEYNYAVGKKIAGWYEPGKVQNAVVLHYHDMMWPENWPTLMDRLKTDRPQIQQWLAELGPLQLGGSTLQKATSKLLRNYRKKQFDKHKAACRVI